MSIKSIGAVMYSKQDAYHLLEAALPLAARFSAHLTGLHGEMIPISAVSPLALPDATMVQVEIEGAKTRSSSLRRLFDDEVRKSGITADWKSSEGYGDSDYSIIRATRSCDLVMVQQRDPQDSTPRNPDINTLIYECGRPLMVIPYAVGVDVAFRRILVAWNGTAAAARATFDALPFIKSSSKTEILCVDPHETSEQDFAVSGAGIAESLARHGANITLTSETSAKIPAGEIIENRLAESGADLLVMGAYSQSWLAKFLFGGVTRTLLKSMPTATLMSR